MQQLMISTIQKNKLISKKRMMNMFKKVYIKNDHQKKLKLKLKKVVFKFKKFNPKFKKRNKLKK
jgi:hypothetical protein